MEITNLGLIVSTSLAVSGWFITSYFNRKHEKLKKQTEYRLMTLESFFSLVSLINSSSNFTEELKLRIENIRINLQLYGYQDELDLYEKFIKSIEKKDLKSGEKAINKLTELIRGRLRKELVLPQIKV